MLVEEGFKTQGSGEGKKGRRDKEDGRKDWVGRRTKGHSLSAQPTRNVSRSPRSCWRLNRYSHLFHLGAAVRTSGFS